MGIFVVQHFDLEISLLTLTENLLSATVLSALFVSLHLILVMTLGSSTIIILFDR